MSRPLIVAHRGASHDAPENTLAAFRLAWDQGADAIETDLRLTSDGHVVAMHDADGRRTLRTHNPLRSMTLDTLREHDAGSWKSSQWAGQLVPTLAEVLATIPQKGRAVLELKEGRELVDRVAAELSTSDFDLSHITIIAFDAETIATIKRKLPDCKALWLFEDYSSLPKGGGEWLNERVESLGVDGLDLGFTHNVQPALLAALHAAGRTLYCYTINSPSEFRRAVELGFHGITTDRPGEARKWLDALSA